MMLVESMGTIHEIELHLVTITTCQIFHHKKFIGESFVNILGMTFLKQKVYPVVENLARDKGYTRCCAI